MFHTIEAMITKKYVVFDPKRHVYKTGPKHMVEFNNIQPLAEFFAFDPGTESWNVYDADGYPLNKRPVKPNDPYFKVMKAV